jgi:hypothetical protein
MSSSRHTATGHRQAAGLGNNGWQAGIKAAWAGRRRSFAGAVRDWNRLSFASSVLQVPDRRLEKAEAGTCCLFGFPIALQFIFGLQAGPFVRIDGLDVGFLVFAIRGRLWREQRRIKPANARLQIGVLRAPAGRLDGRCGRRPDPRRVSGSVARPGILRAACDRHRERNGAEGQQF